MNKLNIPDQATIEITAEYPALVIFCRQYYSNVKGVDPEDIAQETIIRALRKRSSYEIGTNARSWLRTIAMRTMCNMWRKQHRVRGSEMLGISYENFHAQTASPEDKILTNEILATLRVYVSALTDEHRVVWTLRDVEGMSYRDIGKRLDVPVGTVMSRLFRARKSLAELLSEADLPEYKR